MDAHVPPPMFTPAMFSQRASAAPYISIVGPDTKPQEPKARIAALRELLHCRALEGTGLTADECWDLFLETASL